MTTIGNLRNKLLCVMCMLGALGISFDSSAATNEQTAVFAGGCFWGVEAVFRHVKGVSEATSGYAGGAADTAHFEMVMRGDTGHAESVRVRFDPAQVSYRQLLEVFFRVAHDPTQVDRQGPDVGSQYRSMVFFTSPQQEIVALKYMQQLTDKHVYASPIVTVVVPLGKFYPAEEDQQDFVARHPYKPYVVINDLPKLERLQKSYPALFR